MANATITGRESHPARAAASESLRALERAAEEARRAAYVLGRDSREPEAAAAVRACARDLESQTSAARERLDQRLRDEGAASADGTHPFIQPTCTPEESEATARELVGAHPLLRAGNPYDNG